ncbi:hypothetical protein DENSPDRAFT_61182 [Dentipellis sp. KUC8613]|nr:hypothetical protein DENSPDRAFT_61182 [Dentipellis sp. KUC8613]
MTGTTTRTKITMNILPPKLWTSLGQAYSITATEYFSALTATVVVWDTCLNIGNEVRLIWCRPFTRAKFLYLILRYTTLFFQIFQSFVLSGLSYERKSDTVSPCRLWIITTVVGGFVSLALANFILIRQVYALWDHRPRVLQALLAAFVVTYISSMIIAIISLCRMLGSIIYDSETFHICLITSKPVQWAAGWASQVVFDICVFAFTFFNAASRPRLLDDKIVSELLRDGGMSYAVFSGLRLINTVLCAFKNPAFLAPGFFLDWAIVTILVCRLLLHIEHMRLVLPPYNSLVQIHSNTVNEATPI